MEFVLLFIMFIVPFGVAFGLSYMLSGAKIKGECVLCDAPAIAKRLRVQNGWVLAVTAFLFCVIAGACILNIVFEGVRTCLDILAYQLAVELTALLFWLVLASPFLGFAAGFVAGSLRPCKRTVRARTLGVRSLIPWVGGK